MMGAVWSADVGLAVRNKELFASNTAAMADQEPADKAAHELGPAVGDKGRKENVSQIHPP